MKTIILADCNASVRKVLKELLHREVGLRVVRECVSGPETVFYTGYLQPDILITDLTMGQVHALSVIRGVLARAPATRIIVISLQADVAYAEAALRAGAMAFVQKDTCSPALILALEAVLAGRQFVSPSLQAQTQTEDTRQS